MIFSAKIENKKLLFDRERFVQYLGRLKNGRYWIEIKKFQTKRSNGQNKIWHGIWIPIIAQSLGYLEPEDVCKGFKIRLGYCHKEPDNITGGQRFVCRSTSDMGTGEMSEFLEKAEILAKEMGVNLPSKKDMLGA